MFCKNCGTELQDSVKFCTKCGTRLTEAETPADTRQTGFADDLGNVSRNLFDEGIAIIRKIFSKEPLTAIVEAAENKSLIGVVLVIINVLLFAFVSCINTTQTINYVITSVMAGIRKTANAAADFGGLFSVGNVMPSIKIPVLYELFIPFLLIIVSILAAELIIAYLVLKICKRQVDSPLNILNVVAVSGLPISLALIVNLVVGLIFSPIAICIFGAALLVHMVLMYEGIKNLGKFETAPIWEYSMFLLALCIVIMIIGVIAANNTMDSMMDMIRSYANSQMGNLFDMFS